MVASAPTKLTNEFHVQSRGSRVAFVNIIERNLSDNYRRHLKKTYTIVTVIAPSTHFFVTKIAQVVFNTLLLVPELQPQRISHEVFTEPDFCKVGSKIEKFLKDITGPSNR